MKSKKQVKPTKDQIEAIRRVSRRFERDQEQAYLDEVFELENKLGLLSDVIEEYWDV